jgi:hypothetical protein
VNARTWSYFRTCLRRASEGLFASPAAKGAETSIHLASSPSVAGVTGRYYNHCKEAPTSELARDATARRRLAELTATLIGRSPSAAR